MKLKLIDPKLIRANPNQPRQKFKLDKINDIANSIEKYGQINPIIVRKKPKGKTIYEISSGENRWRACKSIKKKVWIIEKKQTESERDRESLVENVLRGDLDSREIFKFSFNLAKQLGPPYLQPDDNVGEWVNVSKLAEYITGEPSKKEDSAAPSKRNYTSFYKKLSIIYKIEKKFLEGKLSPKVKEAIEEGHLTTKTADKMIGGDMDIDTQEQIVEIAKAKSPSEVKKHIEIHNEKELIKKVEDKTNLKITKAELLTKYENRIQRRIEELEDTQRILKEMSKNELLEVLNKNDKGRLGRKTKKLIKVLEATIKVANSMLGNVHGTQKYLTGANKNGSIKSKKRSKNKGS